MFRDQEVDTCFDLTKVAVDVKIEGGLLAVRDRQGMEWLLLSIFRLKPSSVVASPRGNNARINGPVVEAGFPDSRKSILL